MLSILTRCIVGIWYILYARRISHNVGTYKLLVETIIKAMPAGKGALYLRWVPPKEVESIARLANPRRVALVGQDEEDVAHGALMSYSPVVAEDHLLNAMLDRLLRGGNPARIPFELPTRATFVINRKAAAAIGVRFPPEFTVMANRIVD